MDSFKKNLEKLIPAMGSFFKDEKVKEKLKDGKPHKFEIKDGKLTIH